ncbi:ABC transporter ATP-binding protein [Salinibacterium sp. dk2585]|uniref:dipeptide ABC transporter ATP-binding protein n=1 Tax=unclassified Salinibacterium TaxID=2632331 RepID=UPI0011C248B7|nr:MULTISPECIES: ABC transporter ATP-binding protein [unclassified Salinibacterium]QEE61081.1 ABC transporter ATP-binding protein [Salinibacterium sp. dk2585]TXK53023.1 ABC transporter ATP-binding protein [Salinibacterium sp. dk5596]
MSLTLDPATTEIRDAAATGYLVEDLSVTFPGRTAPTVQGVSLALAPGRCLALVGESGSGKSVTARTLVGLTGAGASVRARRLELEGRDLSALRDRQWRGIRGQRVGFVLQDALVSLDPLRPVGREIEEALRLHGWGDRAARRRKVIDLLSAVGVPDPELRARQRPDELSGGLRQRALIASALALSPGVIIADEPTTALDVTVQAQVLHLLEAAKQRGAALLLISHDLAVVSRLADDIAVMHDGRIVEQGAARAVLSAPSHEYTRTLIDAVPSAHTRGSRLAPHVPIVVHEPGPGERRDPGGGPVLTAEGLAKRFPGPGRTSRTAVDGVSFSLAAGETLGIVGESGSGKSTVARMALALTHPDAGRVLLHGQPWTEASRSIRRPLRREITAVYQDPLSSFDPRWTVERIIADSVAGPTRERTARVDQLLDWVGLPRSVRERHPLTLSGGQRQRVAIARALAPRPSVMVLDEAVSALDVSIQAQVLDLLGALQQQLGVSYLFISHDLGVVHHVSDRVLVMKDGRVVEHGDADAVFTAPQQPYTRQLIASLPRLERPAPSKGTA